jgi:hypothetical protein
MQTASTGGRAHAQRPLKLFSFVGALTKSGFYARNAI